MDESRTPATRDVLARARAFGFRLVLRDVDGTVLWAWQQDGEERGLRFSNRGHALDYIEDRLRRLTYFA
jgi:hypothetical protein